jgi:hypothetical protein
MNENCANDSENTLAQFVIEVCHVTSASVHWLVYFQ